MPKTIRSGRRSETKLWTIDQEIRKKSLVLSVIRKTNKWNESWKVLPNSVEIYQIYTHTKMSEIHENWVDVKICENLMFVNFYTVQ